MRNIKNYFWFIKKSQKYMNGYNSIYVFFKSLLLGFKFCKLENDFLKNTKVIYESN